jgi:eukaryotic-like serine/threonine-protein kinase
VVPLRGVTAIPGVDGVVRTADRAHVGREPFSPRLVLAAMSWSRLRATFDALLDLPAAQREARLGELERTDAWLAAQLRSLFATDAGTAGFLDRDPAAGGAWPGQVGNAGGRVGKFELVRPLGSGGMGSVWEARQEQPDRAVAIKLVARHAPGERERWRFQHEAQVLAVLNHPAIATFYEAGTTVLAGTEVAWLAMELVPNAVDVLTWCQQNVLSRDARLHLFLELCAAVDHGHRHGVLHRDLKPSNVLVDGEGRPKLIDFGIARALHGGNGAQHTATGEVLGTVQYMAPEQLAGRSDAIGTPADVWSLGVILYHLLCGQAPFDFAGLSLLQIAQVVAAREPIAPSVACPGLPPDLGCILLRALEKDPVRRYATVRELTDDLARFLADEPVHARPASWPYRWRKFVRRHRVAVGAASTIVAVSVGAAVVIAVALVRTTRAEANERAGRQTAEASLDFLVDVMSSPGPDQRGRDTKMVDALQRAGAEFGERFANEPHVRAVLGRAIGVTMFGLGDLAAAERHLRDAAADAAVARGDAAHADALRVELELMRVLCKQGRLDDADAALREVEQKAGPSPEARLADTIAVHRSDLLRARGDRPGAAALLRPVLERLRASEPASQWTLQVTGLLAGVLHESGDIDGAEPLYREAMQGLVARLGAEHSDTLAATQNLAMVLQSHGRFTAALPVVEQVLAVRRKKLGDQHVDTAHSLVNLGGIHVRMKQLEPAAAALTEAVAILSAGDEGSPVYQAALSNLAVVERDRRNFARAFELGERLLACRQRTRGVSHPETLLTMVTFADTLRQGGEGTRALAMLTRCRELAVAAEPPVLPIAYQCDLSAGWCHAARRDFAAAERCFLQCLADFDAAEKASSSKGRLFRADPDLVALYQLTGKTELAAKYESEHSRARTPDAALRPK